MLGEEHAGGFLLSALESTPHLLVHLAATPEVYTWDMLPLVISTEGQSSIFCQFNVFMANRAISQFH